MESNLTKNDIQEILDQQTKIILDAVDKKITGIDVRIVGFENNFEKEIARLDLKFSQKFDKLTTTLDNF